MENVIKLNEDDTLKLKIVTNDGKDTGEYLEFCLSDIELPLKYQDLIEQDKKNKSWLKNQFMIIEKRQDVKGKKLLSKNEEDKIRAINEFFKKECETFNLFLGENGVQKLLNGRKIGWTTLDEIDEIISNQIAPHFKMTMDDITNKVKERYSKAVERSKGVLK